MSYDAWKTRSPDDDRPPDDEPTREENMNWNYRVIRSREANGQFYYAIHECYYDGDRLPHSWTASPVSGSGETHAELLMTTLQMHRAVLEPVLEQRDERLVEIDVEAAHDQAD